MNDLQSLSQIYQNKLFRIPDYQRGYAWKQEQLVDFWDDIVNLQSERYHYTGLLSLKAVPRSESKEWNNDKWLLDSGYKAYHVVDGQQRLTTFSILINEIVYVAFFLPSAPPTKPIGPSNNPPTAALPTLNPFLLVSTRFQFRDSLHIGQEHGA
jgi:hypothetical protein